MQAIENPYVGAVARKIRNLKKKYATIIQSFDGE
jgi:hypothetical protein